MRTWRCGCMTARHSNGGCISRTAARDPRSADGGQFKDGVGTFVFLDEMEGKTVLVRNVWSGITAKSCHQAWAISADGGKTWVPTWISTDTLGN